MIATETIEHKVLKPEIKGSLARPGYPINPGGTNIDTYTVQNLYNVVFCDLGEEDIVRKELKFIRLIKLTVKINGVAFSDAESKFKRDMPSHIKLHERKFNWLYIVDMFNQIYEDEINKYIEQFKKGYK